MEWSSNRKYDPTRPGISQSKPLTEKSAATFIFTRGEMKLANHSRDKITVIQRWKEKQNTGKTQTDLDFSSRRTHAGAKNHRGSRKIGKTRWHFFGQETGQNEWSSQKNNVEPHGISFSIPYPSRYNAPKWTRTVKTPFKKKTKTNATYWRNSVMKRAKTKTEPEHRYTVSTSLRQKREREREKTRERERERERETYENKRRANRRQMIGGGRRHAEENGSGGSDRSRVQTASHLVPTRNRKPENRRAKRLPDLSEQVTTSPTDSDVFFYIFNPPPLLLFSLRLSLSRRAHASLSPSFFFIALISTRWN